MGWTFTERSKGMTHKEWFGREFNYFKPETQIGGEVVDAASKNGVVYAAYRIYKLVNDEKQTQNIFALVILTKWAKDDRFNFGYKDMDESMGPYYYDCPKRILDLLTPTDSESALKWRQECKEQLAKQNKLFPLKDGAIIQGKEPVLFTDGSRHDTFVVRKNGRKTSFYAYNAERDYVSWMRYRLPKSTLLSHEFAVIGNRGAAD